MNVIVLVNDSLRMDHVGCYEETLATVRYHDGRAVSTPNIDALARESAVFEYAFPEGLPTLPCRTGLWTGRYTFPFRGWGPLQPADVLLPEILMGRSIRSALITDVYHMHAAGMGFGRGFDEVVFIRGQEGEVMGSDPSIPVDLTGHYKSNGKDERVKAQITRYLQNRSHWGPTDDDHFCAQVVKRAARWLEENSKRDNLFLWVDCFDPHEPWDPPEPYASMYADPDYTGAVISHPIPGPVEGYLTPGEVQRTKALYAGECTMVDKWDGVLLDTVRRLGMLDNTMIVFLSDHGEPFGEHGVIRKSSLAGYEELVRIPFMIRHPQGLGAGRRFRHLAQTCDVAPTILDFFGIARDGLPMHGKSLLPTLAGSDEPVRDYAFTGHHGKAWRINDHEWALLCFPGGPRAPELYRYVEDPAMMRNLANERPDVARDLELRIRRFVQEMAMGGR